MQKTHCTKNFGKLFCEIHFFFFNKVFSCFVWSGAPHNTDDAKHEKEEGHDTGTESKVDEAHIKCFKALNFASEEHNQGKGQEEEHALPGGYVPVAPHGVHHVINSKTTTK